MVFLFDEDDDAVAPNLLGCGHGFSLGVGPPGGDGLQGEREGDEGVAGFGICIEIDASNNSYCKCRYKGCKD